jgi:antitoxin ParD1/3/4
LEEEENRVLALKEAIRLGQESGIASDFEPTSHLEKIKNQRKLNV